MIHFSVLGQHFLILGDPQRTTDLFEKRSSNYSDRMRLPMVVDLYVSNPFQLNQFLKNLSIAECVGILTWLFCRTAYGGENIGNHFMSISIQTWCPSTCLFRGERSKLFCVGYLTHPTTSSNIFDSELCVRS